MKQRDNIYHLIPLPEGAKETEGAGGEEQDEGPERVRELEKRVRYLEDFRDGVFEMIKDLDRSESELEAALTKLKSTQAQLIQSSKLNALGELSAGLAHEISQPLTVIKGLAYALLRGEGRAEAEKLKLIFDASERMEQIVRHLRVFSRSDEPVLRPVDVNAVVRDACMIVRETFAKHSIRTITRPGALPPVMGSSTRLEQVLINLFTNARDAMPDGGVMTVTTSVENKGGNSGVLIEVRDTGCGIPEQSILKVFDPFFTTKAAGAGTGLGLSISYGIIKEHNGDITVKSTSGAGTVFSIRLPALAAGG